MKAARFSLVFGLALIAVGCRQTPEKPPFDPGRPEFFAGDVLVWQCELARAFAERDYVRDLLEPEATVTFLMGASDTGRTPSGAPPGSELLAASSSWVGTIALRDRAPLPAVNCPALPGKRMPLRDFLDRLQSELAKLPPEARINSITYTDSGSEDTPRRQGGRIMVNNSGTVIFRLKSPPQPAPAPASPPE